MKKETSLTVKGMTCGGCEKAVERALLMVRGVTSAQAHRDRQQVTIVYNPDDTDANKLRQAIEKAGYQVA
jgi:copper chaperone CopZ